MKMKVLDHGYIQLVETWGSDERIIEAARMSTQKGFEGWGGDPCPECLGAGRLSRTDMLFATYSDAETAKGRCGTCKGSGKTIGDEKLLSFLWKNNHATPFEMAGAIIEVQAPIFVFREWHRHRTQSYNEMSARYAPLPDMNYMPTVKRLMVGTGGTNKQAGTVKGAEQLTEDVAITFLDQLEQLYADAEQFYQDALSKGVPKELARIVLPVGRYSRMRASANLRNWLGFLTLRMATNAQHEIRAYANVVGEMLTSLFPRTMTLFSEGK